MNMKKLLILFSILFLTSLAQATTVSATITDTTGQTFSNGAYSVDFIRSASNQGTIPLWNGVTFKEHGIGGFLDGSGSLNIVLADVLQVTPSGGHWVFTICPNASAQCSIIDTTNLVTGASVNLSTFLSNNTIPPSIYPSNINRAYKDSEVASQQQGSFYYDVINNCIKFGNGTSFTCVGTGGGGGSVNAALSWKYTNDFVWQVTPSSPSSLAANTFVTVNLTACPIGVFGTWPGQVSYYTDPRWYYILVTAGTGGTQEVTRVLGGSCNGDGNPGTLQFITSQIHGTGYQVGTATAGFMEAQFGSVVTIVSGASFSYKLGGTVIVEPGNHKMQAPAVILNNSQRVFFSGGAFLECDFSVDNDCLDAGDPGHYQSANQIIIDRPGLIAGFPNSHRAAIAVFSNQTTINNMVAFTPSVANATFGYGIEVVGDQHFNLNKMQFDAITSQASFVGAKIYAPGPFSGHAGTPYGGALVSVTATSNGSGYAVNDYVTVTQTNGHDSILKVTGTSPLTLSIVAYGAGYVGASGLSLSTLTGAGSGGVVTITAAGGDNAALGNIVGLESGNCAGNGIDWQSSNPLHVQDSVIQGFAQFGIRFSMAGGGYGSVQMDNVYNEATCLNPVDNRLGTAGLIVVGGRAIMNGGEAPSGTIPVFATQTGGTTNYYYIVATDGVNGQSNPLYAGSAVLNNAGPVNVVINKIPGVTSYDLLATTTLYQGPYGTGNWAVATNQAAGTICTGNVCTIVDNQSARTSYTLTSPIGYAPQLTLWTGPVVLSNAATATSPSSTALLKIDYNDFNFIKLTQTNTAGTVVPVIWTNRCILTDGSPVLQSCNGGLQSLAMTYLHVGDNGAGTGLKGRLNFGNTLNGTPTHLTTLMDCNFAKTAASAFGRPAYDSCDSFIGVDQFGGPASVGISFGASVSISNYIGNVGDGTNWLERLTAALKILKVPLNVNSGGNSCVTVFGTTGSAAICAASTAGSPNTLNLPTATGNNGQVLSTNGANPQQLTWVTTSGTVAYSTPSAATTTSISATTMATAGSSGNTYRFSVYLDETVVGSGCTANSPLTVSIIFTDATGVAATQSLEQISITNNGSVGALPTTASTLGTMNVGGIFRTNGSTVVQYSTTYTPSGTCTTAPTYRAYPILEVLN